MNNKLTVLLFIMMLLIVMTATSTANTDTIVAAVNQNGTSLTSFLNSLNVEQYWAKGQYVNWGNRRDSAW